MSQSTAPKVSIIIPAFNMEQHIGETLDSALAQTFTSFEVIVVDDCSTDSTPAIVSDYIARDSRVRYVRLNENSNRPAVPRNRGIIEASGQYIAFLDHDDTWEEYKLERQVRVLDSRPNIALVHSHLLVVEGSKRSRGFLYLPNPFRLRASYEVLRRRNLVQCSAAIGRTEVFRELGGFDERPELRAVEDYHLWLRLSKEHGIAYIPEIHGRYRFAPTSTSSLENMQERQKYQDSHERTLLAASRPSLPKRLFLKLGGYPIAVYFHLIDGRIRRILGLPPKVFRPRT